MIHGTTEGRFLDHPSYDGLLAEAVALDVPIYIHPHFAPAPCAKPITPDLVEGAGRVLEAAAWGWHSETAVHVLAHGAGRHARQAPQAQAHHWPYGRDAAGDARPHRQSIRARRRLFERPISRTILDQVWITTSGIFTEPPFLAALQTFGIDRIMFSVDYPYAPNTAGRSFLNRISIVARRHGQALPRHRRRAAEIEGLSAIAKIEAIATRPCKRLPHCGMDVAASFGLPLAWAIGYSLTHMRPPAPGRNGRYSYMIGP